VAVTAVTVAVIAAVRQLMTIGGSVWKLVRSIAICGVGCLMPRAPLQSLVVDLRTHGGIVTRLLVTRRQPEVANVISFAVRRKCNDATIGISTGTVKALVHILYM